MELQKQELLRSSLNNAYVMLLCRTVTDDGAPNNLITYGIDKLDYYVATAPNSGDSRKALDVITHGADFLLRQAPASWDGIITTMADNSCGLLLISNNKASVYSLKDVVEEYMKDTKARQFWGTPSEAVLEKAKLPQQPRSQQGSAQPTAPAPAAPTPPPPPPQPQKVTSSDATQKVANAFKNSGDLLNQLSQSAASKKDTSTKVQQAFNNSEFFKNMSGGNK